ncbi:MAG: 5-dehydro-4-deoxy-D-glucuronate isomerase [Ignavibacteriaceae bacterium]
MEVRYTPDHSDYKHKTTGEIRKSFLIDNLFTASKIEMVYTDVDRAIVGSAVPVDQALKLESSKKEMASDYFTERREIGIINIGAEGKIVVDGKEFSMELKDCLYVGRGAKDIKFFSKNPNQPAKFYFVSYPAHSEYKINHIKFIDAEPANLGTIKESNKRTIYKYIHQNGIKSSQLVMGLTELDEGSVWNTMPAHTHQRRTEIYMYFNLLDNSMAIHLMGEPEETRHIIVRNQDVVISPSWSIHSAAGTQNYTFIWAMGGENQAFDDMDVVPMKSLK